MDKYIRFFILLSIVFSSFSAWFAIHDYVRLPMIFLGCALFLTSFFRPAALFKDPYGCKRERLFLWIFLLCFLVSFFINSIINETPKTLSNGIATMVIIAVFYFFYSSMCFTYLSSKDVISALGTAGLLLMFVIFIDELLVNVFSIKLASLVRLGGEDVLHSYFQWGFWYSSSAPTEEPAYAAMSLNILAPFAILRFSKIRWFLLFFYCTLLMGLCSTQGIASALFCLFVTFITLNINLAKKMKILMYITFLLLLVVLCIGWGNITDFLEAMTFFDKISMSGNTNSDVARQDAWIQAIIDGNNAPIIGQGPGYGKFLINGYLSTFLGFYAMYGAVAAIAFLIFWFLIYKKCFYLNAEIRPYFIYSFTSTFVIGMVIDQLHMFIFWLLPSMIVPLSKYKTKN